jgi:hypothetical protein
MKVEKIKTISIIVLSVLLAISVFAHIFCFTLLGISSIESFKRTMLAEELLSSFSTLTPESSDDISADSNVGTSQPDTSIDNSNNETTQATTSAVVFDAAGIKITYTGVEYDTFWECYTLKFAIENNSDTDVIITSAEEVIDGYMVDSSIGFYCEVLAGKKAVEYMTLYNFDLEPLGISKPGNIEFIFDVTASDDIFHDIISSDKIIINIK